VQQAPNWDSNAVLCGTWQIPGGSTSAQHYLRRGIEAAVFMLFTSLPQQQSPQSLAAAIRCYGDHLLPRERRRRRQVPPVGPVTNHFQ
jgi:hypothetical protein